ncbi:MAG: DMT family transporter [Xanthomonadaceae bacterium]|nr:DMT family transporter [Xanthomonadaceae bacterium]
MNTQTSTSTPGPRRVDPGGVLLAALGAIAFSGKAIVVKLSFRYGVDAVTLLALRMVVALPCFVALGWWSARKAGQPLQRSDYPKIVGLGFFGYYLASYLDFAGLAYITATLERLILYLTPTLVLLVSVLVYKRKVSRIQIAALLISYVGVGLAFGHDMQAGGDNIALGSLLVFGSALTYAIYLIGSGQMVARVGAVRLTACATGVASVFCIAQFLILRPVSILAELPHQVYWLSLLNGTLCTVLPVIMVMMGVARIGPTLASQIGMIGPVSTIVLSLLLLGEPMGVIQVTGTVLVLIGALAASQVKR